VNEGLEALRWMRLQRKEVEVLVETPEKWCLQRSLEERERYLKRNLQSA